LRTIDRTENRWFPPSLKKAQNPRAANLSNCVKKFRGANLVLSEISREIRAPPIFRK